jgi:hypothetical protein
MNDEQEILPDRSVDLGDGVFWAMDLDRYELRDSSGRVYYFMAGDGVRIIQQKEKMAVPKQAFIFGLYLRTASGEWVLRSDS